MLDLIIVGAGGFGRELLEMVGDVFAPNEYRVKGFLAQDAAGLREHGIDLPLLGDPEEYQPQPSERFLLAIGFIDVRRRVVEKLTEKGGQFATFVHPQARIARTATIGVGAVIYPFCVVSNSATLAPHVHMNYYSSVGHDCRIGQYVLLAPYATLNGFVTLEDEVYVSTHATVAPGRKLGYRSKISANSACMQDAPENTLVFGVPGRQVRRID